MFRSQLKRICYLYIVFGLKTRTLNNDDDDIDDCYYASWDRFNEADLSTLLTLSRFVIKCSRVADSLLQNIIEYFAVQVGLVYRVKYEMNLEQ